MNEYLGYALLLFDKSQWHVFVVMLLAVSAVTETVKWVFLLESGKNQKARVLYATAFVGGVLASIAGFYTSTVVLPLWFWGLSAVVLGPVSNFLHWLSLGLVAWKFPGLADALKGKKR